MMRYMTVAARTKTQLTGYIPLSLPDEAGRVYVDVYGCAGAHPKSH